LLHPIAPFVTEELWLALPHDGATIMTATWPDPLEVPVDRAAAARFEAAMATVEGLRNERAENGIADRARAAVIVPAVPAGMRPLADLVLHFAKGDEIAGPAAGDSPETFLAGFAVQIDAAARRTRLERDAARLRSEVERGEKKLGNAAFVAKAAADVVAKEREKLDGYRAELARVEAALAPAEERS
jgi:valyl-tRNA synthetase